MKVKRSLALVGVLVLLLGLGLAGRVAAEQPGEPLRERWWGSRDRTRTGMAR